MLPAMGPCSQPSGLPVQGRACDPERACCASAAGWVRVSITTCTHGSGHRAEGQGAGVGGWVGSRAQASTRPAGGPTASHSEKTFACAPKRTSVPLLHLPIVPTETYQEILPSLSTPGPNYKQRGASLWRPQEPPGRDACQRSMAASGCRLRRLPGGTCASRLHAVAMCRATSR